MSTQKKVNSQKAKNEDFKTKNPVLTIFLKAVLLCLIIFGCIYVSDSKGIFNPDLRNNHTLRKWNSFYDFTEKHDVDILLVGNSHLYTGINPKNLSTALGCNAFILASPGTHVDDHYYAIKEAFKVNLPKVLVVETYGLKKVDAQAKKTSALSDQFKSFSARKDIGIKLASTCNLFAVKNYPYAWSNTLRNHDYLYTNKKQIQLNLDNKNNATHSRKKLYLGRYVRFTSGIENDVLKRYETEGASVKGTDYESNDAQADYINKIAQLCKSKGVELIFLTLPMYEKHVDNYAVWKEKLEESLGDYASDEFWIDMQTAPGYNGFSTHSFENTYKKNQHMTYNGSLLATYKLVDFINKRSRIKLPNKKSDKSWRKIFYFEEGFMENNTPYQKDKNNLILYASTKEIVKEVLLLKRGNHNKILAKVKPSSKKQFNALKSKKIQLSVLIKSKEGQLQNTTINLSFDLLYSTTKDMKFSKHVQPFEIEKIIDISFVN